MLEQPQRNCHKNIRSCLIHYFSGRSIPGDGLGVSLKHIKAESEFSTQKARRHPLYNYANFLPLEIIVAILLTPNN